MKPPHRDLAELRPAPKFEGMDWDQILEILRLRRKLILSITGIAFALLAVYTTFLPNVYTGHSSILVERVDESPLHYKEVALPMGESGPTFYETRVGLLKSFPIMMQVVEDLGLVEHYHKTHPKIRTSQDAALYLKTKVRASVIGRSQIVKLEATDYEPEMAAKITNSIAENFIRESWKEKLFISDQLLKWFPAEAKTLQTASPIQQLHSLSKEEIVNSLPSIMQDPVIQGLKQDLMKLDGEMRELSRRYTEEHPKMKELRGRADYLQSEIKSQTEKIIMGLKTGLSGEMNINSIKVVENAIVPTAPSGPKRVLIVLGWTVFVGIFFSWIVIFLESLNRYVRTDQDIKRLSLTFLGYLPKINQLSSAEDYNKDKKKSSKSRRPQLADVLKRDQRLADDITNIRTSLIFSMPRDESKFIMCTSCIPSEGKTTVSTLLAIGLAQAGMRVLVIDADMRKPALHHGLGLENRRGLSDCLVGTAFAQDVIQTIEEPAPFHVLTAGGTPPNPAVLMSSDAMQELMTSLAPEYDKIIFDVPPAFHIADALIIAERMHGIVLVFRAGKIHMKLAGKIIDKIHEAQGRILGAVINRAEYQKLDSSYHRYYQQYSKYYAHAHDRVETTV